MEVWRFWKIGVFLILRVRDFKGRGFEGGVFFVVTRFEGEGGIFIIFVFFFGVFCIL